MKLITFELSCIKSSTFIKNIFRFLGLILRDSLKLVQILLKIYWDPLGLCSDSFVRQSVYFFLKGWSSLSLVVCLPAKNSGVLIKKQEKTTAEFVLSIFAAHLSAKNLTIFFREGKATAKLSCPSVFPVIFFPFLRSIWRNNRQAASSSVSFESWQLSICWAHQFTTAIFRIPPDVERRGRVFSTQTDLRLFWIMT